MRCENNLCVFWDEDSCTLKKTSLDALGLCQECINLEFDEKTMKKARKALLARLAENDEALAQLIKARPKP